MIGKQKTHKVDCIKDAKTRHKRATQSCLHNSLMYDHCCDCPLKYPSGHTSPRRFDEIKTLLLRRVLLGDQVDYLVGHSTIFFQTSQVDTWRNNNDIITSKWRFDVVWRYFYAMCPLTGERVLTLWGREKMIAIFQTTFSKCMNVQIMACASHTTSHYLIFTDICRVQFFDLAWTSIGRTSSAPNRDQSRETILVFSVSDRGIRGAQIVTQQFYAI